MSLNASNQLISTINGIASNALTLPTGSGGLSFWSQTGNNIYYNSGNVGIGTATPQYKLDLAGSGADGNYAIRIKNTVSGARQTAEFRAENNVGSSARMFKLSSAYGVYKTLNNNDLGFYNAQSGNISILNDVGGGNILLTAGASSSPHLMIRSDGKIGIGSVAPTEKLEVVGAVKIVDGTQGIDKVLTSDASGKASWQNKNNGGVLADRPANPSLYATYLVTDDGGPYLSVYIGGGVWKKIVLN